jgi:hypothetical protein
MVMGFLSRLRPGYVRSTLRRARPAPSRPGLRLEELERRELPATVGVYALIDPGTPIPSAVLQNPNVDGVALRANWDHLEPTEGIYKWSDPHDQNNLDSQVAAAAGAGKKVSISVTAGYRTPAWVYSAGAHSFPDPDHGGVPIPKSWEPVYLARWTPFVQALGQHYAGNAAVVQVKITGINRTTQETALLPSQPGFSYAPADITGAWQQVAGAFATAFPNQQLAGMFYLDSFSPHDASGIDAAIIQQGITSSYGSRFVVQNNGLADYSFAPNDSQSLVASYSTRVTTGYQMIWSVTGDTTYQVYYPRKSIVQDPMPTPPLTLAQELQQAVDLGSRHNARFLEIYLVDVNDVADTALQAALAQAHSGLSAHFRLSAPAGATAGSAFPLTVTALDLHNNPLPGYRGAVHVTSTDGLATLPGDYTFTPSDNGGHTFTVTLRTAGSQTVSATDTTTGAFSGSATVVVNQAPTGPGSGPDSGPWLLDAGVGLFLARSPLEDSRSARPRD